MNKEQATKLAKEKYGPTAYADKPVLKDYQGKPYFYSCPFYVYKGDKIMGWGHSWKQALAGPCPHYKGKWPPKPVKIACVIVPASPFHKKSLAC
jgi:hypothetical protein